MASKSVKGAVWAAAVASLVAVPTAGHKAHGTEGVTVAGNSCSGKNGCGAKPKDPNAPKKAPQGIA